MKILSPLFMCSSLILGTMKIRSVVVGETLVFNHIKTSNEEILFYSSCWLEGRGGGASLHFLS